jgi:NADH:ubiquinone oxidoreductase subunit 6 (subunit J)
MNLQTSISVAEAAEYTVLLLSAGVIVAGSIATVVARKTMYAILGLVGVALGVSAMFALYGYTYLAAFNIAVYVGAGLTFVALVVMFTGYYRTRIEHSASKFLLALAAGLALQTPLLVYARHSAHQSRAPPFGEVAASLLSCRVCVFIVIVAIASVLIEAIALARGEAKVSQEETETTQSEQYKNLAGQR